MFLYFRWWYKLWRPLNWIVHQLLKGPRFHDNQPIFFFFFFKSYFKKDHGLLWIINWQPWLNNSLSLHLWYVSDLKDDSQLHHMEIRLHYCATFTYRGGARGGWGEGGSGRDNGILTQLYPEDMVSVWLYFHCDNYSSEFKTGLDDQSHMRLTSMQFSDLIHGYMKTINHL